MESAMSCQYITFINLHLVVICIFVLRCGTSPIVRLNTGSAIYVQNGGSLTLTCDVDMDVGLGSVLFRRDTSVIQIWIYDVHLCTYTKPDARDRFNYSVTCSGQRSFTIVKYGIDTNEHKREWNCQMSSRSTDAGPCIGSYNPCFSNGVTVIIRVPVTTVRITDTFGQSVVSNVTVENGTSTVFRCDTSPNGSRPEATFRWFMKHENQSAIPIDSQSITNSQNTIPVQSTSDTDIVISNSTLTLVGSKIFNNVYIFCAATDDNDTERYVLSVEVQLDIAYRPHVRLIPNVTTYTVTLGTHNLNLTCQVVDANPQPTTNGFRWTHNGTNMEGHTSSVYTIGSVQRLHSGHYQCAASNVYGTENSDPLYLSVQYPPLLILIDSPIKAIEGHTLEVLCTADGNPTPHLFWSPPGEDTWNLSRLYYKSLSRIQSVIHTCTAINTMTPSDGHQQNGSDSKNVLIDVLYTPSINPFQSHIDAIEGHPLEVLCTSDGNPAPVISWSPPGDDTLNRSRLYYQSITRHKTGIYTCTASNTMEPTSGQMQRGHYSANVSINVLYNASIKEFSTENNTSEIIENGMLQLCCHIDSNPYSVISLYFQDDLICKAEGTLEMNYSRAAGCLDAGNYTCSATNSVMNGTYVSASNHIKVRCHPRLDNRTNTPNEYRQALRETLALEIHVIAYPEPKDITWYHRDQDNDTWQRLASQPSSASGLSSSVHIYLGSENDFGQYKVNMSNDIGIYERTYHIIRKDIQADCNAGTIISARIPSDTYDKHQSNGNSDEHSYASLGQEVHSEVGHKLYENTRITT